LQELLELWLSVQSKWLYLEPIFSSVDIVKQLPVEGEAFQVANESWDQVMRAVRANPSCLFVRNLAQILEQLQLADKKLEVINRGLANYLQTKRLCFSRFFFLSNDELLEILSETKDPRCVQPFLAKCFEGIDALTFDEDDHIVGIVSKEGEKVELSDHVIPAHAQG
jgi:dynein heavy chain